MNNISNFFRKCSFVQMILPLTSLPQSWRGGSWTVAVFALFIKLGAQFARWVCNKQLFLQGASMARWTYFSSRSHFWVNFWNLSLLMFFLLLPYKLQVYSSKVLNVLSSSVTLFPNIDSVARNFGFTQAFFRELFFLCWKMRMYNHIQWVSGDLSFLNVAHYQ